MLQLCPAHLFLHLCKTDLNITQRVLLYRECKSIVDKIFFTVFKSDINFSNSKPRERGCAVTMDNFAPPVCIKRRQQYKTLLFSSPQLRARELFWSLFVRCLSVSSSICLSVCILFFTSGPIQHKLYTKHCLVTGIKIWLNDWEFVNTFEKSSAQK